MPALNYFDSSTVGDNTYVTSHINRAELVSRIQVAGVDPYFDATTEIGKVYVYYRHEDGRQQKKIIHDGTALTGLVFWTDNARDGTWEKYQVKTFDHDGAYNFLYRDDIGTSEDVDHTNGITNLNIS